MGTKITAQNKIWQKKENNSVQTKSGSGFDEVLNLSVKSLSVGKYRIQWNAEARLQSGSTSRPKVRIKLDGTVIGIKIWKNADQEWEGYSGWDFSAFSEGDTPSLTMEVQRNGGTDTVEVRKLKISIELMED